VLERWRAAGFRAVHLVDLDAATGRGSNREVVLRLLGVPGVELQVGGGVRDEAGIAALLEAGAARVVVGTRALEEPAWLAAVAAKFPGRLVVAADAWLDSHPGR
jgi:phosphoribosyl isomerase A